MCVREKERYQPCALGDGAQGHGLFDLSQRQHHSEAGQWDEPRVPHVVIGEIVVRILAAQFGWKTHRKMQDY